MTYETTHLSNIKTLALKQGCRDTTYPSCSKSHMAITADNTFKILRIMKRTLNLAIEQQNRGGYRCEATHIFARVTSLSNKPVF